MESFTVRIPLSALWNPKPRTHGHKVLLHGKTAESTSLIKRQSIFVEVSLLFCHLDQSWFNIWCPQTGWVLRHVSQSPHLWATFPVSTLPISFPSLSPIPLYQEHGCSLSSLTRSLAASLQSWPETFRFCHLCLLKWFKPHHVALLVCQVNPVWVLFFICLYLSSLCRSACLSMGWYRHLPTSKAEAFCHSPHKYIQHSDTQVKSRFNIQGP